MPEIKVKLPPEVHQKLKDYAEEDDRSLTKYIERGLKYLSDNPYHRPGVQPVPAPIVTPIPGIPEYPYTVTATTTTAGLVQTPALNIEQLQEQGVSQIKFNKPTIARQLSPEEEELHQAKLQQQMSRIKQQRIKFLKQKADEILGYTLPYLEENNQKTIDWVLNQYPTDEDIITYLQNLKIEDENYIEENEQEEEITEPQNEYYQKIKRHYAQHLGPHDFEDLITNARVRAINYLKDYHQLNMFDALDIPHSHSWTNEEWNEIIDLLVE